VVFNVDMLNVYGNLSTNASLSNQIADQAGVFVDSFERPTSPNLDSTDVARTQERIAELLGDDYVGALKSPLGLGWEWQSEQICACFCINCIKFWALKLAGWLTTALGISLGATFWFDALKKLVSIRNSSGGSK
ncbi:MAG: hypothetical protein RLZ62_2481, partial [Bacteroidota bacterium]